MRHFTRFFSILRSSFSPLNFILIGLPCIALIYAAYYGAMEHRVLTLEGSDIVWNIFDSGEFIALRGLNGRFLDLFWHLPAELLQEFGASIKTVIFALDFTYGFLPIFSLMACALILTIQKNLIYLIFPITSLSLATLPSMVSPSLPAHAAVSLFWPALFLIFFPFLTVFSEIILALLLFALTFTYLPSVLLHYILLLVVIVQFSKQAMPRTRFFYLAGLCIFGISLPLFGLTPIGKDLFRVGDPSAGGSILDGIFNSPYFLHTTLISFGLLGSALLLKLVSRPKRSLIIFISIQFFVLVLISSIYLTMTQLEDFHLAFNLRGSEIPITAVLALSLFLVESTTLFTFSFARTLFKLCTCILLITAVTLDIKMTTRWKKGLAEFDTKVLKKEGCFFINQNEYEKYASVGILKATPTALLRQAMVDGKVTAYFAHHPDSNASFKLTCSMDQQYVIGMGSDMPIQLMDKNYYIDISPLIHWTKKQFPPNGVVER